MLSVTSRLRSELRESSVGWTTIDGTGLLADLSGFTGLTETLVARGSEGIELLHRSLSACFEALLRGPVESGGDVIGFAGDAALIWFDGSDHVERAARAAARMPHDLASIPASLTAHTRLRASIGLHTGQFIAVSVRLGRRQGVALCGPHMSRLAALEQAADSDQVMMSPSTAECLPHSWHRTTEHGTVLDQARVDKVRRRRIDAAGIAPLDTGEHRHVSVGFVMAPGLDALFTSHGAEAVAARVQRVSSLITEIADAHAVTVIDTDVGIDCVKFYLAAGAPRTVDADDARLLQTLRRVIDDADVPLRAGAQRGPCFSDLLGAHGRRVFTVLGDTVNVAARALGKAGDGELIAADGLTEGLNRWMTATPLGPQQLKNRAAPMPMWSVHGVAPPARRSVRASESSVDDFRRTEWDRLAGLWKETVDGGGASVAIVGEVGMGSSELVTSLADLAGGGSTTIVADRFLVDVPYSGVSTIIAALASARGVEGEAAALDWLSTFRSSLVPSLQDWAPAALQLVRGTSSGDLEPGTAARRARQVLVALITAAAPRRWLLAVESSDHLDEASRQVLVGLVAQATSAGHLIVTTHERPDALTAAADVTIELEPLADEAVTRALHDIAPQLRDEQVSRLVAAAGGNPLVLSALLQRGADGVLPDSVHVLASVIVDSLPSRIRQAVLDAAVFGIEFDTVSLANVLSDDELRSPSLWHRANKVLRSIDDHTWRFRNEAYRDVAYRTSSFERRRRLHGAIADHLDARGADRGLVALHLHAAGRVDEAYPCAVSAARSAYARGAAMTAGDLFERAVAMARAIDRPSVGKLLIDLGRSRTAAGDLEGAADAFRAAGRCRLDDTTRVRVCHLRADLAITRRQLDAASHWIRRGRAVSATTPEEYVARLQLCEAVVLDLKGRHRQALTPARRALELATSNNDRHLLAHAHLQLESILFNLMDPEVLVHGRSLVALATELDDDHLLAQALNNIGLTAMYFGEWNEALEHYRRARSHAERCGNVRDAATVDQNTGFLLYRQGRLDQAEACAREARRILIAVRDEFSVGLCTLLLAMIEIARERWEDGASLLAEARARLLALGDTQAVVDCDVVGMDLLLRQGRNIDVCTQAIRVAPDLVHAELEVTVSYERILGVAEGPAGIGRLRAALERARDLHLVYEVYLCLGALAEATGDAEVIAEHLALRESLGIVG